MLAHLIRKNLPDDALVVEFKLGEGIKVEDKDPNTGEVTKTTKGGKDSPVLYKEYKVKPGTDLSTYIHPTLKKLSSILSTKRLTKGTPNLYGRVKMLTMPRILWQHLTTMSLPLRRLRHLK